METHWLDRRIAAPGPYLALCLYEEEYLQIAQDLKWKHTTNWISNKWSHATTHFVENPAGEEVVVVCMNGWEGRSPIEVAGLLVHEAVHVWQSYADRIGEKSPGAEQEAYAIQSISQELMAEFARRIGEMK